LTQLSLVMSVTCHVSTMITAFSDGESEVWGSSSPDSYH